MTAVQRLRVSFSRGEAAKYVSHLDLARLWERALRRARLPVAYSAGFTPHARLAFAAPLAVGITASAELVDVYLSELVPPARALAALAEQLPPGLAIGDVAEVDLVEPALQAGVRAADYVLTFAEEVPELAAAVANLLANEEAPVERRREGKVVKTFDLRPFVLALAVLPAEGPARLAARLRLDTAGGARPDELLAALGLPEKPVRVHRAGLVLAEAREESGL